MPCRSCGESNAPDARFCAACGERLDDAPASEVRKTVTVVFADLADSTGLGERLDPESVRRVIARYFEVAKGCLERHGASVEKFIGDAVMAVFGVPTVHEDDALRAIRAAAELQHRIAELEPELLSEYGITLQVRVGVNTGEVIVGTAERLATGDALNVAARLQSAAQPGEVLLGRTTYRLARDAITAESAGDLVLKGKTEPVAAYRLIDVSASGETFARRWDAPFTGRRIELDRLRDAFANALGERHCELVVVAGPPGIGKSRLAQEFTAGLPAAARVLAGRCLPYGDGMTFWPLREIFTAANASDDLDAALAAHGTEETFWQVRKALENQARERPLILLIEDIHWAEPTLLDLIEHLVEWTKNAPIVLLCSARPELLDARPAWAGRPNMHVVTLDPLDPNDSNRLIETLLGDTTDISVRDRIRGVAAGNPLFVEQLVAALLEGDTDGDVPVTIHALLAARLETLSSDERDVLERASVVGLEFEWEALIVLSGDGRRPPGAVLTGLIRKQLISRHEVVEDMFRFDHMLIRDVAYERLAKSRRADLHERLARWLDGFGTEFAEIVGYHFEQAHRCLADLGLQSDRAQDLASEAAERLSASGMRAFARGDSTAAANLLRRSTHLLTGDPLRRAELQVALGQALRDAGRMDDAVQILTEAVDLAEGAQQRAALADARIILGEIQLHRSIESGVTREDVLRELATGITVFEELSDDARLGRALCIAGKLHFWKGETSDSLVDFERSALHAQRAGDDAQEALSLQGVAAALFHGPTPLETAIARMTEIRRHMSSNHSLVVAVACHVGELECQRGRFDIGRPMIDEALAITDEYSLPLLRIVSALKSKGSVELLAGDAAAAEGTLREACLRAEEMGERGYLSSLAPLLVDALVALDRIDDALEASDRWRAEDLTVPEDAEAHASWHRTRALALARAGQLSDAEQLVEDALAIVSATDYLSLYASTHRTLGEVLQAAGRQDEAIEASARALAAFERKGNTVMAARIQAVLADIH